MLTENINVDICIATYKRVAWLKKLLSSLAAQILDAHVNIRIIIIDNDPEKSAQSMVASFFSNKDVPYIYDTQPEKNIALTRNKALDHASAEYIAFVDDDEWVAPNWLGSLLSTCQQYDADVVFGPVIPELPDDAPLWVRTGGFFNRPRTKTGTIKQDGGTNNSLVLKSSRINKLLRFDPDYGVSGGEDTELFCRLYANGARLIWCNEALAYESVPYNRMTVNWITKRALRGGQIFAKIHLRNAPLPQKLAWLFQRFFYLLVSSLLLPISLFMGKARWVWVLRKIMANFGQLTILFFNNPYQEYK